MPLLEDKIERRVVGLMSGTSLDGVDAVAARLKGSGPALEIEQLAFTSHPYPKPLRDLLLRNSKADASSVHDLSQLNVRLAHVYADAVREVANAGDMVLSDVDLIGSHGQTVHHVPESADCAGEPVSSTFQIGDPSVLANRIGIPVVGDFRLADMALDGQGAPLAPYFDYVYFTDEEETRGLLNLGGIANLTVLPPNAIPADVRAFDTGPANMVIDALAERYLDTAIDKDGQHAARGDVDNELLARLLDDEYFIRQPPKSTGRERFGSGYVDDLVRQAASHGVTEANDLLATATTLTAASVYQAYARFVRSEYELDVLIVAGGGVHNASLMERLRESFRPIPVREAGEYNLDADAKEALCFAVLAHETANGVPTNLPAVTGARHATLLGKLCVPMTQP